MADERPAGDEGVVWSRESDAGVDVLGPDGADPDSGAPGHDGHEVEVLPRAEDRQVGVSHAPGGGFERRQVRAAVYYEAAVDLDRGNAEALRHAEWARQRLGQWADA